MKYTIKRTKRNFIILCSSFLIVCQIVLGLFFFFNGPTKLDTLQIVIRNILYMIPYGYLMLVFVDYFKHYQLKVLQIITITILIFEIVTIGCVFINLYNPIISRFILSVISAIWVITIIIWIILLFRPKIKDYTAMLSIRNFAVGMLLFLVVGIIPSIPSIPSLVKPTNIFAMLQLVSIALAIPFIFTIDFAMKLQLKE